MKNESLAWIRYADENLQSAHILLECRLYNPCLQNVQQCIEKYLKAVLLEKQHVLRKTHTISELVRMLVESGVDIELNDEDCDMLDAVYLPSKYPLGGVLPSFEPDEILCKQCVALAEHVAKKTKELLSVKF
jgi:HEPN domain-containing protein